MPFGYMASNMLNVCNLATLEWSQVTCKGDPPTRSYGHVICHFYLWVIHWGEGLSMKIEFSGISVFFAQQIC